MMSVPRAAAGVAAATTAILLLAGCGGQTPGASWAACQEASEAMKRLNSTMEDHEADKADRDDAARALQKAQSRVERAASKARADDVSDEAAKMAEYLENLSDGYADRDDDTITEARAGFRQHANRFVDACEDAWGRQL